ncbi:hypothetical protein F5X68DRAFT_26180 [Plectosphaerella plurivora]|uniref:Uncharacterized protein n=1 Tax=Plectosphaerella plurivora TaxID=936078 RepID=A0A9P9AA19_9PEZI|nr:hypothetical protein F5X68DRAFT_26180 [Plectosphaerella plurivora]
MHMRHVHTSTMCLRSNGIRHDHSPPSRGTKTDMHASKTRRTPSAGDRATQTIITAGLFLLLHVAPCDLTPALPPLRSVVGRLARHRRINGSSGSPSSKLTSVGVGVQPCNATSKGGPTQRPDRGGMDSNRLDSTTRCISGLVVCQCGRVGTCHHIRGGLDSEPGLALTATARPSVGDRRLCCRTQPRSPAGIAISTYHASAPTPRHQGPAALQAIPSSEDIPARKTLTSSAQGHESGGALRALTNQKTSTYLIRLFIPLNGPETASKLVSRLLDSAKKTSGLGLEVLCPTLALPRPKTPAFLQATASPMTIAEIPERRFLQTRLGACLGPAWWTA